MHLYGYISMVDNTLTNGFASFCSVMSNLRLAALRHHGERKGLFHIWYVDSHFLCIRYQLTIGQLDSEG